MLVLTYVWACPLVALLTCSRLSTMPLASTYGHPHTMTQQLPSSTCLSITHTGCLAFIVLCTCPQDHVQAAWLMTH